MSTMAKFVSEYSKKYRLFNEDTLFNIRKNDQIVEYIDKLWKEVAKSLPGEFTYLGWNWEDSSAHYKELNQDDSAKVETKAMSIYKTYGRLAIFKFKLTVVNRRTKQEESRLVNVPIYIPLYIDNYHFYIRGNKYSAPFQLIDAITYSNKKNLLVLKTMTRPIKLSKTKEIIKDLSGNEYRTHVFNIHLTSKAIPFLMYYFAYYGVVNTIKYFGGDGVIKFYKNYNPGEASPNELYFKF